MTLKKIQVMVVAALLVAAGGFFSDAEALLDSHECSFCHNLHGGPGVEGLLSATSSELVCLSCHTVSINDTAAAEVHNPGSLASDALGYITCRECHDGHDNQGGNVKMVGYKRDAENWYQSFTPPAIREEVPATIGLNYVVTTYTGPTDFNIADPGLHGPCEACHNPFHNAGNDCTVCHGHSDGFMPSGGCTSCHDGTDPAAPVVVDSSPHALDNILARTGSSYSCSTCHSGHDAGTVIIPNNTAVGIDYSSPGHSGISLGSVTVTGATEAQICWTCHDSHGISEWGDNMHAATGDSPYDYGSVDDSNWTLATWSSGHTEFAYKTGAIQSTHTANPSVSDVALTGSDYAYSETLNAVADIRCSYCHDVHELAQAPGDTAAGKPYLRGSWRGNPYEEDGAPRASYAGTSYFPSISQTNQNGGSSGWGAVPRASESQNYLGGYWVDENNVVPMTATTSADGTPALNPTSGWSTDDFAGLCFLCHMTGEGIVAGKVDNMDQTTGEALWLGTNGHANAVKGGTGSSSPNAFNAFGTRGATTWFDNNPPMNYVDFVQNSTTYGCLDKKGDIVAGNGPGEKCNVGFRGSLGEGYAPAISPNQNFMWGVHQWGVTVDSSTIDSYHQFSCSKCHNPHASRLPKLMITNCLDTKHNTWDNQFQLNSAGGTNNDDREMAGWTSAQNCHRLARINPNAGNSQEYRSGAVDGVGDGWNKVTPWTSATNTE